MIITLKGANFADSNIGTLSTWRISKVLGTGATYDGVTLIARGAALNARVVLEENYEVGSAGVTVTMGGEAVTSGITIEGNVITISIESVTGNVVITVPTINISTGEEDGGNEDNEIITYELPLRDVGVGVTSTGTGRASASTTRLSNASTTEQLGILVPNGHIITLEGLASGTYPLRFDYVCGTKNVTNPISTSTAAIEGLIGTASDYNSDNYFPLNLNGANTYSLINNYGQDCYFWFGFAGLNKTEPITAEIGTYYITYTITDASAITDSDWLDMPLTQKALGVTSTGTGRVSENNAKRFSTADDTAANAILIPANKIMYIKGLASGTYPLRMDYIYIKNNVACPASGSTTAIEGLVGTASNYDSNHYFPLNNIMGEDTLAIKNSYGQDYYFYFGFAGQTLSETILNEFDTYDIKYYIL